MAHDAPIFVHAWWRSASTYVWSKLRRVEHLRCYYEPLHERVARLQEADLQQPETTFSRALRHPPSGDHYFAEYGPLLRAGKLPYSTELAYARYLLRADEGDDALQAYLQSLLDGARGAGQRAVLCFCRSQMRSAWMKHHFDAVHVAQVRNPASQFASFSVAKYFPATMATIAARLCRRFPGAFDHIPALGRQVAAGNALVLAPGELLAIFALLWAASTAQAVDTADLVLDVDRASTDRTARDEASAWFESQGCAIDFEDCAVPGAASASSLDGPVREAIEAAASALRGHARALAVFDASRVAGKVHELSGASRAALECVLS